MKTLAHQRTRTELLRRLVDLRPDSPRRWGRMTAHQMVCHLSDACLMAAGDKPVSPATGTFERTIVKWIALYVPLAWPAGIVTRPEIDQAAGGGTCPSDFAADLGRLAALLERLAGRPGDADWPLHPIFGRMSHAQWMRWAYLHTDHHLRQFGA